MSLQEIPPTPTFTPSVPEGESWKFYYTAGSARIAMRLKNVYGEQVYYFFSDHLGSTNVITDPNGNVVSETLYKAWGEVRYSAGSMPTDYTYTGQRSEMDDIGLMFYNARFYDPELGRFAQADNIIPAKKVSVSWDRYAYVRNNPILFNDPRGHDVGCAGYDASRCNGSNNNLNIELEKRKYDVTPVVEFIYTEMINNSNSDTVQSLRDLNKSTEWAHQLAAYEIWAMKVGPGQEWDHKAKIRKMEEDANRNPNFQFTGSREYHFDTWSNIHYGYVGKSAGFSSDTLLDGAGFAQAVVDLFKPNTNPFANPNTQGFRAFDPLEDRTAIQIGIDLWDQYHGDILPTDIIWAIENSEGLWIK